MKVFPKWLSEWHKAFPACQGMVILFLSVALGAASAPVQASSKGTASYTYLTSENILLKNGPAVTMSDFGDKLEQHLDSIRGKYRVAGVAVALIQSVHAGKRTHRSPRFIQSGTAGRDANGQWHAVDARKTLFDVASLTKRLVAWTMIHKQAELGIDITKSPFVSPNNLTLTGCEWNPWKGGAYPGAEQGFTLGNVIQHKAGLIMEGLNDLYPWGWPALLYGPDSSRKNALPSLCQDLNGRHNTTLTGRLVFRKNLVGKFAYSSGNYGLLQMLIEQKTPGTGFDAFMQQVMEDDLNMHHSTFCYDPVDYLAGRRGHNDGLYLSQTYTSYINRALNSPARLRLLVNKACAGLFSTVEDYARFADRLMIGGLRPGTMDDVNIFCDENRLSSFDREHFPTALGNDVYIFRGENVGWATRVILDPEHGNALVIFTNTADPIADLLGYGTGENLIREVFDAWMLTSGYGPALKNYHSRSWNGKTVKACVPYYGE